jgi:hypothetical protein
MMNKRLSDHREEHGRRPAMNIDAARVIAVAETPEQLTLSAAALFKAFCGVGRLKNGFTADDAADKFELRTVMLNLVYDVGISYKQLREDATGHSARKLRTAHINSEPQGDQPR